MKKCDKTNRKYSKLFWVTYKILTYFKGLMTTTDSKKLNYKIWSQWLPKLYLYMIVHKMGWNSCFINHYLIIGCISQSVCWLQTCKTSNMIVTEIHMYHHHIIITVLHQKSIVYWAKHVIKVNMLHTVSNASLQCTVVKLPRCTFLKQNNHLFSRLEQIFF